MQHQSIFTLLKRLWRHIARRRRIQFGVLFILIIFASFAEVITVGAVLPFLAVLTAPEQVYTQPFLQPFIKLLDISEPKQLLLPLTCIFALSALLSGAMRLMLMWAQTRLSHAIGSDFSINTYRRTLYQPYTVHVARNSSEVIAGVRDKANALVHRTIFPIIVIASSIMILMTIMVALFTIQPAIAISSFIGFGLIYVLVIKLTKNALIRDSKRINKESVQVVKALQEGLGGIRDVLIDGTQSTYCNIYNKADIPLRRAEANIQIIGSSPRFGIEALGMVLIASLAYSLASSEVVISNTIPVLGALALGAQRLLPVLQQAYSSWTSLRGGQASLSDALDLLDQELPAYANELLVTPIPFLHSITFTKLFFKYTPQSPFVLKGLDFTITKGARIGFIGPTGSGKSTLLDIVMGLLHPTEGSLTVDGKKITDQNHRGWQAHIAHVPQAIFLADTSIAENIAFGIPFEQIDYARVRQSAQKAQIDNTIELLDNQYSTLVGERGVRLSGGQRQRIGIARALYKNADVIVFDEATSALDNDTERAVMKAIENLGDDLTIIIVAHRLTTLKSCTQIIQLEDGRIKRSGSYQHIIEQ